MIPSESISVAFYDTSSWKTSKVPTNVEVSWKELTEILTDGQASPCTSGTCVGKKCPHKQSSDPSGGAWSPVIIEGWRSNENVKGITVLVLDADGITQEQLKTVASKIQGFDYVVHTTHRHRTDAIFIRLIVRLSRPVLPSEWPKFYPASITHLGLNGIFDSTCKDVSRLYFLPTHPSDVQFLSDVGTGNPLPVDAILAVALPVPPAPEFAVASDASSEGFTDLGNLVAMLSTYRRSRARDAEGIERSALIGRLLAGKPLAAPGGNAEPTPIAPPEDLPKGRGYAIMRAAGICTGYLPADVPDEAYLEIFRKSIDAMCFGRDSDRLEMEQHLLEKLRIGRDHRKQFDAEAASRNTAAKTYQVALAEERERARKAASVPTGEVVVDELVENNDWLSELKTSKKGDGLLTDGNNAYLILKNSDELRGAFRWDEVHMCIKTFGLFANTEPEVLDVKVSNYLSAKWGLTLAPNIVYRQVLAVAYEDRFDPIQDYLNGIVWDNTPRIATRGGWLVTYVGAKPSDDGYVEKVGQIYLVGAVARAMEPGCKNDTVLVLEGEQGIGKSSLFEILGGEYYADMALAIADKDSKLIAGRSWICELPDLAALKKATEINAVKAFFSTRNDTFRPPYGRTPITSPRRNVFGGTTNEEQYLADLTGNRRYLPIECVQIDLSALRRDRDQIWAEAVVLYKKHLNECADKSKCGCWWLIGEDAKRAGKRADERLQDSPFEQAIGEWWTDMCPEERPRQLTTNMVAKEAMHCTQDRITHWMLGEVGKVLKKMGFKKTRAQIENKFAQVYVPTDGLLALPQSEAGKRKRPTLRVVK